MQNMMIFHLPNSQRWKKNHNKININFQFIYGADHENIFEENRREEKAAIIKLRTSGASREDVSII
jgi:hypothetical protein